MQPVVTAKRLGWLAATTIILGVIIGAGAGLLTLLLYGVEHVMLGYVEGSELPGPFGVPAVRRAISVTIGLTLAGIIWYFFAQQDHQGALGQKSRGGGADACKADLGACGAADRYRRFGRVHWTRSRSS